MKIATTTGDFSIYCGNDAERIRELHRAGFRYIDLNLYRMPPECAYMQENWREEVQKLQALAEKLGMQFVQAHSPGGNPLSDNEEEVEYLVATTIRSIEICGMLGIKNTVSHSGTKEGLSKAEWFAENKRFVERLLPAAERCAVNLLCENSTWKNTGTRYFVNNGKDMREFIEYVNHPMFHGCWDTGHGNCEGNQYDDIVALGEELYALHYNDNRGTMDEHVAPFLGTMNHDEVLHALIDIDYKGYFTLECDSSLRGYDHWLGVRRRFEGDSRLRMPQLFMQRHIEAMLYDTAKWLLETYGLLES